MMEIEGEGEAMVINMEDPYETIRTYMSDSNPFIQLNIDDYPLYIIYLIKLYELALQENNLYLEYFDSFIMKKTFINIINLDPFINEDNQIVLDKLNKFYSNDHHQSLQEIAEDSDKWCKTYGAYSNINIISHILIDIYKPIMKLTKEQTYFESGVKYLSNNIKLKKEYNELIMIFLPFLENFLLLFFPPEYWSIFTYNFIIKNLIRYKQDQSNIDSSIGNRFFDRIDIRNINQYTDKEVLQKHFLKNIIPITNNSLYNKIIDIRYKSISYSDNIKEDNISKDYENIFEELSKFQLGYLTDILKIKSDPLIYYIQEALHYDVKLDDGIINNHIKDYEFNKYNLMDQKKLICESIFGRFEHRLTSIVPKDIKSKLKEDWQNYILGGDLVKKAASIEITDLLDSYIDSTFRGYKFSRKIEDQIYLYYLLYDLSEYKSNETFRKIMSIKRKILNPAIEESYSIFDDFMERVFASQEDDHISHSVWNFFNITLLSDELPMIIETETGSTEPILTSTKEVFEYIRDYTLYKIDLFKNNFIKKKEYKNKTITEVKYYCDTKDITQSIFYNKLLSLIVPLNIYRTTEFDQDTGKKVLIIKKEIGSLYIGLNEYFSLLYPDNTVAIETDQNQRLVFICQSNDSIIHELVNHNIPINGYNLIIKYNNSKVLDVISLGKNTNYNNILLSVFDNPLQGNNNNYRVLILLYLCIRFYDGYTQDSTFNVITTFKKESSNKKDLINAFLKLANVLFEPNQKIDYYLRIIEKQNITESTLSANKQSTGIQYIEIEKSYQISKTNILNLSSTLISKYFRPLSIKLYEPSLNKNLANSIFNNIPIEYDIKINREITSLYEIEQHLTEEDLEDIVINHEMYGKMEIDDKIKIELKDTPIRSRMVFYNTPEMNKFDLDVTNMKFEDIVESLKDYIDKMEDNDIDICINTVGVKFTQDSDYKLIQEHEHFVKIKSLLFQELINSLRVNKQLNDAIDISFKIRILKDDKISYDFSQEYQPLSYLYKKDEQEDVKRKTHYNSHIPAIIVYHNTKGERQHPFEEKIQDIKATTDIMTRLSCEYTNHYEFFFDIIDLYRLSERSLALSNPFEDLLLLSGRCKNIDNIRTFKPYNMYIRPEIRNPGKETAKPKPKKKDIRKIPVPCKNILSNLNTYISEYIDPNNKIKSDAITYILKKFWEDFSVLGDELIMKYKDENYFFGKAGGVNYRALQLFISNIFHNTDFSKKKIFFTPLVYMISLYFDKLYLNHVCDTVEIELLFTDKKNKLSSSSKPIKHIIKYNKDLLKIVLPDKGNDPFLTIYPYYDIETTIVYNLLGLLNTGIKIDEINKIIDLRKKITEPNNFGILGSICGAIKGKILELINVTLTKTKSKVLTNKEVIKIKKDLVYDQLLYDFEYALQYAKEQYKIFVENIQKTMIEERAKLANDDKRKYFKESVETKKKEYIQKWESILDKIEDTTRLLFLNNGKGEPLIEKTIEKKNKENIVGYIKTIKGYDLLPNISIDMKDGNIIKFETKLLTIGIDKIRIKFIHHIYKIQTEIDRLQNLIVRDDLTINYKGEGAEFKTQLEDTLKGEIKKLYKELLQKEEENGMNYNTETIRDYFEHLQENSKKRIHHDFSKRLNKLRKVLPDKFSNTIIKLYRNPSTMTKEYKEAFIAYFVDIKSNFEIDDKIKLFNKILGIPLLGSPNTNYAYDIVNAGKHKPPNTLIYKNKDTKERPNAIVVEEPTKKTKGGGGEESPKNPQEIVVEEPTKKTKEIVVEEPTKKTKEMVVEEPTKKTKEMVVEEPTKKTKGGGGGGEEEAKIEPNIIRLTKIQKLTKIKERIEYKDSSSSELSHEFKEDVPDISPEKSTSESVAGSDSDSDTPDEDKIKSIEEFSYEDENADVSPETEEEVMIIDLNDEVFQIKEGEQSIVTFKKRQTKI